VFFFVKIYDIVKEIWTTWKGREKMVFENIEQIKTYFSEHQFQSEVHEAIDFLLERVNDVQSGEFVGRTITDYYCNGFFGRRYDLTGSEIIENGNNFITIRDPDGADHTTYFSPGWQIRDMRTLIEEWT